MLLPTAIGSDIGSMYKNLDRKQDVGHFFCLLHIDTLMDLETFKQRMDRTIDMLKASKRRPGVDEILIPGERSARLAKANRKAGISISPETLLELRSCCDRFNIKFHLPEVTA